MDAAVATVLVSLIGGAFSLAGIWATRQGKRHENAITKADRSMAYLEKSRDAAIEDMERWKARALEAEAKILRMKYKENTHDPDQSRSG